MPLSAKILLQALEIYVQHAYPTPPGPPPAVLAKLQAVRNAGDAPLSESLLPGILEKNDVHATGHAVRLGQPVYPHMKLAIDPVGPDDYVFRVDAHDRHLRAPPGSPDERWLSDVRTKNQQLVQQIESAWDAAGLPTFRALLRQQLAAKRSRLDGHP